MVMMTPNYQTKLFSNIYSNHDDFLKDWKESGLYRAQIKDDNVKYLFYLLYAKYGNSPIANFDETQFKYKMWSIIATEGPNWEKKMDIQETLRKMDEIELLMLEKYDYTLDRTANNESTINGANNSDRITTENGSVTGTDTTTTDATNLTTDDTTETTTRNNRQDTEGTITDSGRSKTDSSDEREDLLNHAFNPPTDPATTSDEILTYIDQQNHNKSSDEAKSETTTNNIKDTDMSVHTVDNEGLHRGGTTTVDTDAEVTLDTTRITTSNNKDTLNTTNTEESSSDMTGKDTFTSTKSKGKINAYAELWAILDVDVTSEFINRFKICFKQFVIPEYPTLYFTEEDE